MDETQQTPAAVEQPAAMQPAPAQPTAAATPITSTKYASFGKRFLAVLIDAVLIGIVTSVLARITGTSYEVTNNGVTTTTTGSFWNLLGLVYYVYMVYKYGATLGKMAMNIRVQNVETGANLTIGQAILREVVGKMLSAIALGLGYLWMLWDPKKQTWHDMIAKSVVVEVEKKA